MQHFYASIKGNRGEATRGGDINSGIKGYVNASGFGFMFTCKHEDGKDVCDIYKTKVTGTSISQEKHIVRILRQD